MALQKVLDRTDETGDTYPVAYWRIDGLEWRRIDTVLEVKVGVYKDQASAAAKQPVVTHTFIARGSVVNQIMTANDIRAAIYMWLKTRNEFEGATDV